MDLKENYHVLIINLTFVYMSEGVSAQVGVPESGIVIQHVIGAFSPPP